MNTYVTSQAHPGRCLRAAVTLAGALLLAACASTPPPTASLQAAQQAIANAERVEAARYAAGELSEARTKLASADSAVKEEKMVMAERFAEQSRAEAELAAAKSTSAKARSVNDEMAHSNDTLTQELQRTSGDKP